ncbi:hypothetical protein TWF106_007848 [Orbilia oligospora]|uniref:Ketoreductase domain-containing protein n=1 Tax=Orbilia oligospora TaxID=2813651 RepID=A0A6G1LXJ5_ORBOL|nr:hypothetical protein TWF788_010215 [Orbilia oligospora]KAF3204697.1 hypothetical protein TWF679_009561 [Orbilia oligospora]KAF3217885.1 hypothetical protein TWF106_007848 [Orbilia oligospora]KAF3218261.1 hypothetical protein TWF191_008304 [Orbilia oligospora]KAF3236818.1 hypothetical protein TWF192_011274 [Orbilia oligospora]
MPEISGNTGYKPLQGKLAIVTGASRGIGAAIATKLASYGATLVLNYTSPSSAQKTQDLADSLSATYGTSSIIVKADLGDTSVGEDIITAIKTSPLYSTSTRPLKVDIIINNAGISKNTKTVDITPAIFDEHYRINVLGPLLLVQAAIPYLPYDGSGRIVSLSSVSATLGLPGQAIYGGTKAALEAMTRTWARELAERCTATCVNPGPVVTDMYGGTSEEFKEVMRPFIEHAPLMNAGGAKGRGATSEEIAGCVGMLCLPDSYWCTGSVVSCNGGMLMGI